MKAFVFGSLMGIFIVFSIFNYQVFFPKFKEGDCLKYRDDRYIKIIGKEIFDYKYKFIHKNGIESGLTFRLNIGYIEKYFYKVDCNETNK